MKKSILIAVFLFLAQYIKAQELKKISVSIEYTNSYCGGAKPTPEIIAKSNTKYKLAGWVLRLEEEGGGKPILVKTDKEGKFSKDVKLGTYNIYLTKKINKTAKTNVDVNCKKMMARNYGQIVVKKGHSPNYVLTFGFGCSPCAPAKP